MKKLYTTAFALLATGATTLSFGQSPRLAVVEHFTQASCGPCASQNPILEATLNANSGSVIAVKHQVSWPGTDPMNAHYPAGPEDRRNYYGITGVPNTCLDGAGPGAPNTIVTSATISARVAIPSPFTLDVSHTVSGGAISVTVDATCSQTVSGDLRLFIAVVEREIIFASAPGSNGETEFYNVLKQYIGSGGTSGNNIAASWAVSDNASYTENWTLSNVYDDNQLSVIAWIQDVTTKEIHQGGYSAPVATNNLSAMAFGLQDLPKEVCGGTIYPSVIIRNSGGTDLTSVNINVDVNGLTSTIPWTGNLAFLENETVSLSAINFNPQATNTITVTLSDPNGGTDDYPADDAASETFNEAVEGTSDVTLTIVPDNYGSETTWNVTDAIGTVIYSGGPFVDGQTTPEVTSMVLPISGCFEFNIFDSFGDGICCDWGAGSYTLISNGTTLLSGGEFSAEEQRLFKVLSTDVVENNLVNFFSVYPNPTSDVSTVAISLSEGAHVALEIYNAMGQLVYSADKGSIQAGSHNFTIDFNNLESGVYFVNILADDSKITKRVTNMK